MCPRELGPPIIPPSGLLRALGRSWMGWVGGCGQCGLSVLDGTSLLELGCVTANGWLISQWINTPMLMALMASDGAPGSEEEELMSPSRPAMRLLLASNVPQGRPFPICSVQSLWWCVVGTLEPSKWASPSRGQEGCWGWWSPIQGSQPSPAPSPGFVTSLGFYHFRFPWEQAELLIQGKGSPPL